MPIFETNPDLKLLGTETAFGFDAEVMAVEKTNKFPQIYKFHIGDTGPKTPEPIINTAIQALKDKQTKYGHFQGYPQVRANIARHWTKTRGVEIKPENIILAPGGKPIIELTMQALLAPGDYVIGQNPGYPIYESLAKFYSRGNYLPWLARHNPDTQILEFHIEDLEKILQSDKKIKLLAINTPQNPTGMIIPRAKLEAIAELAKKYNFMVLFDDIYDQIIFNKEHFSLLSVPGMLDYTINLNGYAKNYAMTGWRVGFAVAPEWLIKIFGQLAINKWSCVNRVDQITAGAIYGDIELDKCHYPSVADQIAETIKSDVALYAKKGKFLEEALRLLLHYVVVNEAEGAFYLFPNIAKLLELPYVKNDLSISSDKNFSHWLLCENGLAALAGSDFGEGGRGHLRFSYSEDQEKHIIPGVKHFIKIVIDLIAKSGLTPPLKMEEVEEKVNKIVKKYF